MSRFYDATRWAFLHKRSRAVDSLRLRTGESVIEIGVGTGHNLSALARQVGPEGHVVGLDLSREMLLRAHLRVSRNRWSHVRLIRGDVRCFPLSRSFDAVLFSSSLSMIPDRDDALDAVASRVRGYSVERWCGGYGHLLTGRT